MFSLLLKCCAIFFFHTKLPTQYAPIERQPGLSLDTRCPAKSGVACYRDIGRLLQLTKHEVGGWHYEGINLQITTNITCTSHSVLKNLMVLATLLRTCCLQKFGPSQECTGSCLDAAAIYRLLWRLCRQILNCTSRNNGVPWGETEMHHQRLTLQLGRGFYVSWSQEQCSTDSPPPRQQH